MKLTKKLKTKIDAWFNSKTPEEVLEIASKHGINQNTDCICNTGGAGYCHKHHTDWI